MNCDLARELLFEEQEALASAEERAALHGHLAACAACRAEEAALREAYVVLGEGMQAMTAPVTPSPEFWTRLNAGLDAVDAERRAADAPARGAIARWRVRWAATLGLLAALLAGLVANGEAQHAWAALRQWLSFVPVLGVGQVEPTALVLSAPAAGGNGTATLTVTGLVSGHRATLLSYTLRGTALAAPTTAAPVADAVDVVLVGTHGRRYLPAYWLPVQRGLDHGVPTISGMLSFPPLDRHERAVRLVATRLPLAPTSPRPWTLTLPLQPAGRGGVQTSFPLDRAVTRHGIRIAVTDVTLTGASTVVDMDAAVVRGPYAGGVVTSLAPEQATGPFAPLLYAGHGAVGARVAPLPAPVRLAILPRPEFVFPTAGGAAGTVVVPAVAVQLPQSAAVTVAPGATGPVRLGPLTLSIARAEVVTPPAALGLDGQQSLRLTLAFPPGSAGSPQSVDVVVGGVSRTASRDDPQVDIPLSAGERQVRVTLQDAVVAIHGPWRVPMGEKQ